MGKNKKKLIFFMPSIDGGGVEKNLILIANYFVKKLSKVSLITYDKKFNHLFNKNIEIINVEQNKINPEQTGKALRVASHHLKST